MQIHRKFFTAISIQSIEMSSEVVTQVEQPSANRLDQQFVTPQRGTTLPVGNSHEFDRVQITTASLSHLNTSMPSRPGRRIQPTIIRTLATPQSEIHSRALSPPRITPLQLPESSHTTNSQNFRLTNISQSDTQRELAIDSQNEIDTSFLRRTGYPDSFDAIAVDSDATDQQLYENSEVMDPCWNKSQVVLTPNQFQQIRRLQNKEIEQNSLFELFYKHFQFAENCELGSFVQCTLCLGPIFSYFQCSQCQNIICSACTVKLTSKKCPYCQWLVKNFTISFWPRHLLPHFDNSKIKCKNCAEVIQWKDMNDHLKACSISCPFSCGEKFTRVNMASHLNSCPESPALCEFELFGCKTHDIRRNLREHQLYLCNYSSFVSLYTQWFKTVKHLYPKTYTDFIVDNRIYAVWHPKKNKYIACKIKKITKLKLEIKHAISTSNKLSKVKVPRTTLSFFPLSTPTETDEALTENSVIPIPLPLTNEQNGSRQYLASFNQSSHIYESEVAETSVS